MQLPIFVSKIVSKHFLKYRYSHHMLNDLKIKSLKPREELYRVADHSGLCIEIRPSGSKFWRYRYRFLTKAKNAHNRSISRNYFSIRSLENNGISRTTR